MDIKKFKKIDDWSLDDYTDNYTILAAGRSLTYNIPKSTTINGSLRKGSYIAVIKGKNHKITSATIITQTKFNKLQKERN